MSRRIAFTAALLSAVALGGCARLHVPYLKGDGPFLPRSEVDIGTDSRVDPVQTRHPVAVGTRPPCKFGGKRCPPWERAWPANHGVSPADKVTDAGEVKPAKPASP